MMGSLWHGCIQYQKLLAVVRLFSWSSSLRRAVHNLIKQNYIEPGGNLLKDQAILDIKECYLNIT